MLEVRKAKSAKKKKTARFESGKEDHGDKPNLKVVDFEARKKRFAEDKGHQVAGDFLHYLNYPIAELREAFQYDHWMWKVDRYYPDAEFGPLYIDLPQTDREVQACQLKAEVMSNAGYRYCFIAPQANLEDIVRRLKIELDHSSHRPPQTS